MNSISAEELKTRIVSGKEFALIDVRTKGEFAKAHLLFAVSIPLDKLELVFHQLVPRFETPIILCDDGSGMAERAADRLIQFGYNRIDILQGGIHAWKEAGYEIFSGINVPSKAFGEFVEQRYSTPHLSANELKAKIDAGEKLVILDSRPMQEFTKMNIPGAYCCPGAELVYRVSDASIDSETMVVVNCAGRTRSIIGCQSLINAGVPNPVVAAHKASCSSTGSGTLMRSRLFFTSACSIWRPGNNKQALSSRFLNSRTLPGHGYRIISACAPSVKMGWLA